MSRWAVRLCVWVWLLVAGVLIGGVVIPHAQDKPRILTALECEAGR